MAKITNGRVVAEVPDNKADHYCLMTGFHIMHEETVVEEQITTQAPKRRGRPKKETNVKD